MGNDTPLAVLSDRHRLIYSYFKQLFAQVTNPPIDSIREAIVMSLQASIGSEKNLFDETPEHARQLVLETPILLDSELEQLRQVHSAIFKARTLDMTWPVAEGPAGMDVALDRLCREADEALAEGINILIISDRAVGPERAAVPSLLATAAVHHHLVREGTRLQAGLVVESGETRSVHSVATLIGYGAAAVNPYLMLETLAELVELGWLPEDMTADQAQARAVKGLGKGLLKTLSKMGISTIPSYCGAQIFEAVGLVARARRAPLHRHGLAHRRRRHRDLRARHARAARAGVSRATRDTLLPVIGLYAWRRDGEHHQWNPDTIALLQDAVRNEKWETYEEYAQGGERGRRAAVHAARPAALPRGRRRRHPARRGRAGERDREALRHRRNVARLDLARGARDARDRDEPDRRPLEHRRGRRGSRPVHARTRTATCAARRSSRWPPGRFGVTIDYLTNADELQIKMAQGAKPGEGGQLPGPQGRPLHRERAPDDARRRPDLAAAAPRHLLDRGPEAADLRPPLRQPEGARLGEARGRGRRRHRRGRGREGERRPRADLGPRRRHRRLAALVDPLRRHPVGDRPRRDAADARPQRPPLAHLGADGRADQDGPRRRRRGAARCRRGRLRDRPR